MSTTSCQIEANPDVSGLGIRISIYTLCLGGHILRYLVKLFFSKEDYREFSRSIDSALSLQGLAILATAIYQTFNHQLTLFHAICVAHLLALLGINVVARGSYNGFGPFRLAASIVSTCIVMCAFMAFNTYVWAKAPTYGSQPECNSSTVYVVFGVSIKATRPVLRWLMVATFASIPAGFTITLLLMLPCLLCIGCARKRHPGSVTYTTTRDSDIEPKRQNKELLQAVAYVAFGIYAIVSLEQTIGRNDVAAEERQWTFGQVIAVFLLLGPANELLNMILANVDRKKQPEPEGQELIAS